MTGATRWGSFLPRESALRALESTRTSVCVTKANQASPWLLFEGGALAKHKSLHVLLIDASPTDIQPPLDLYQHTIAEKERVTRTVSCAT